jgi:CheY-like chemotaxis protein
MPEGRVCRRVIVVDDDVAIREVLSQLLQMQGYEVTSACNGREAMACLRLRGEACLILLDLMMPVMDGWTFRDEQRRDPELASIPVVVISAVGDAREKAAALEAAGYLDKPLDYDELLEAVGRHCG